MNEQEALICFSRVHKVPIRQPNYNHRCTNKCALWHWKKGVATVCHEHRTVHFCGSDCTIAQPSPGNEGMTCPITGYVVGMVPGEYLQGNAFDKFGSSMAHNTASKGPPQCKLTSTIQFCIARTIEILFTSPMRKQMLLKTTLGIAGKIRSSLCKSRNSFREASVVITRGLQLANQKLNGVVSDDHPYLKTLSTAIAKYWGKFNFTGRQVVIYAFTAAVVDLLRTGFLLGDVVMVPKDTFVAQFAPTQQQMPLLLKIPSKTITAATNQIYFESKTEDGVPLLQKRFV